MEVSTRAGNQAAFPRTALYTANGDQTSQPADGIVVQGGPDRAARKSSFCICKPQSTFLWPSMASGSGITTSGGASISRPRPGLPRIPSRPGTGSTGPGPGLPTSSRTPFEVMATTPGPDEHMTLGALATPPSASSTTTAAAATKLQLSLFSPRSPSAIRPQQLFTATAAAGFSTSPGRQSFSSGALRHVVSSLACTPSSSLLLLMLSRSFTLCKFK
jgi:hypothetical protein